MIISSRNWLILSLLFITVTALAQTPSVKQAGSLRHVVVSAHPLASDAGLSVLKQGGNAFDAAIATQLALAVVYPRAGNLGGGGFLVARMKEGTAFSIDFRETAPASAFDSMYINPLTGSADPAKSLNGPGAAGVPGTVAGLFETYRYARLPFDSLILPAIRLARDGFRITAREAEKLNEYRSAFERNNYAPHPFVKKDSWKEGDVLLQPELALTLERIRKEGSDGFYRGETARLILDCSVKGGGFFSPEDLKGYQVKVHDVYSFTVDNYRFLTMPPPSSGGIIMQQVLGMMQILDKKEGKARTLTEMYPRYIEACRRAYADRSEWMGDPAYFEVPADTLVSPDYLRLRIAAFDPKKAGSSDMTGPGMFTESDETTHLSIADSFGNAVAVTTTLNGNYGCKTVVPGAGFFLNNEMDDFSIQPGVPNQFGAVGGQANAIKPGKRMLSSMTPLIIERDSLLFAVLGAPGGTTIPASVMQVFLFITRYGMKGAEAVRMARLHHQWQPDVVYHERDADTRILDSLRKMGYTLTERTPFGSVELIIRENDGLWEGVADDRGDDSVGGE